MHFHSSSPTLPRASYGWPALGFCLVLLNLAIWPDRAAPTLVILLIKAALMSAGLGALYLRRLPATDFGRVLRILQTVFLLATVVSALQVADTARPLLAKPLEPWLNAR